MRRLKLTRQEPVLSQRETYNIAYEKALNDAYKWLEDNIGEELTVIGSGTVSISYKNVLDKFKTNFNLK